MFAYVKNYVYKIFAQKLNEWCYKSLIRMFLKLMALPNNLVLIFRFKAHNLEFMNCSWNLFSTEIYSWKRQPES